MPRAWRTREPPREVGGHVLALVAPLALGRLCRDLVAFLIDVHLNLARIRLQPFPGI